MWSHVFFHVFSSSRVFTKPLKGNGTLEFPFLFKSPQENSWLNNIAFSSFLPYFVPKKFSMKRINNMPFSLKPPFFVLLFYILYVCSN